MKISRIITLVVCSLITYRVSAQDPIQKAFESSYALEKSYNYTAACQSLLDVYNDKNYELNVRIGYLKYMSGLYTESVNYYNKAIAIMPYAIEPKIGITYPLAAANKWDEVVAQYNAILKIDPKNTSICYKLGTIYYNRKKYSQAYSLFERVVNLYPFDYDGLLMYAWCNYRLGKLPQAKLLFKKVLWISPSDKSALEGLSMIK